MTIESVGGMRGLPARIAIALALPIAFVMSGLIHAQAPAPAAPRQTTGAGDRLPVRRVVLYKSGVGYFE